jgi:hypothetical protein
MSIQFNLLPDIKIQYLKARRQQHLVVLASIVAGIIALTIFVLLLTVVYGLQKKNLNDLNADIKSASQELQATKDLDKILTVQNQLSALPALHDQKVVSSRLFDLLSQVTPASVSINKLNVDWAASTMIIAGSADKLATVNQYTDTLKFTNYSVKNQEGDKRAFSDVVLTSFTRSTADTTYEMNVKFDPAIFLGTNDIKLSVPEIISTRSEVDKPTALFQEDQ